MYRYIELFQRTGDVKPRSYHHGPSTLLGDLEQLVLLRLNWITLASILVKFKQDFLQNLESQLTYREVIQLVALQHSDKQRAKFMADVLRHDPSMLLWINESGCDQRNCMQKHRYSL